MITFWSEDFDASSLSSKRAFSAIMFRNFSGAKKGGRKNALRALISKAASNRINNFLMISSHKAKGDQEKNRNSNLKIHSKIAKKSLLVLQSIFFCSAQAKYDPKA